MEENKMVAHIGVKMGMRIKEKREFLSMSLEEVSSFSNITPGYLGLVEKGRRNLKLVELDTLMEVLNMDLDALIDKEEMILEQNIIDFFEEFNADDLKILMNICDLLMKSKIK